MKVRFDDEHGVKIYLSDVDNVFVPNVGDLVSFKDEFFRITARFIDYDENVINLDMERE